MYYLNLADIQNFNFYKVCFAIYIIIVAEEIFFNLINKVKFNAKIPVFIILYKM